MNFVEAVKLAKITGTGIYKRGADPTERCIAIQSDRNDRLVLKCGSETLPWQPTAIDILGEWEVAPLVIRLTEADRATLEINQTAHGGKQIAIQTPAEITIRRLSE